MSHRRTPTMQFHLHAVQTHAELHDALPTGTRACLLLRSDENTSQTPSNPSNGIFPCPWTAQFPTQDCPLLVQLPLGPGMALVSVELHLRPGVKSASSRTADPVSRSHAAHVPSHSPGPRISHQQPAT